jgi:predicted transcriptional regulator YdeE
MNIITIAPCNIIGISIKTANNDETKLLKDMQSLWQRFFAEDVSGQIPHKASPDIYCVYTDYEGDYTQPYVALLGYKVDKLEQVPAGLIGRSFAGGSYMQQMVSGDPQQGVVYEAWQKIWNMELTRSYLADFEIYNANASDPQNAEISILVGVKP